MEIDLPGPDEAPVAPATTTASARAAGASPARVRRPRVRRRRPSGEPPPLPRELRASGRFWLIAVLAAITSFVLQLVINHDTLAVEHADTALLQWIASIRTPWLTEVAKAVSTVGSDNVSLALRWATIVALIYFRRLRHLAVFVGAVLVIGWVGTVLPTLVARPRPLGIPILGDWAGFSMPSASVAALAGTLLGIGFVLFPDGRWKVRWFWTADVVVALLCLSRIYLAVDHPTDDVFGVVMGMGLMVLAFRFFAPEQVFPVTYRRGTSAHLDLEGARGDAIRAAMRDQLGLEVLQIEPFGLAGSGGSSPMRLQVRDEDGTELWVFGKGYAATHLRADRNYKFVRSIMYGRLEDEKSFASVRQLVQYEDYMLRVMHDAGVNVAKTYGFIELSPEREYVLITEFLAGAVEIGGATVDQSVIDSGLTIVRQLWDAGIAHRDIKPSNIMVRDDEALLIDVAFAEVRPSPWREAIDLANMMSVLGLTAEPAFVYERALQLFTPDDVGEAFAAVRDVRSVAVPSQLRNEIKRRTKETGRDLLAEFRAMAPTHAPIPIQRWSIRRIAITAWTVFLIVMGLLLILSNLRGAGLL